MERHDCRGPLSTGAWVAVISDSTKISICEVEVYGAGDAYFTFYNALQSFKIELKGTIKIYYALHKKGLTNFLTKMNNIH